MAGKTTEELMTSLGMSESGAKRIGNNRNVGDWNATTGTGGKIGSFLTADDLTDSLFANFGIKDKTVSRVFNPAGFIADWAGWNNDKADAANSQQAEIDANTAKLGDLLRSKPDLTDKSVQAARARAAQTASMGQGRKSTFITGLQT